MDSHEEFVEFFNKERPGGIDQGFEWQLWDGAVSETDSKWARRHKISQVYNEVNGIKLASPLKGVKMPAYFWNPSLFYIWQKQRFKRTEYLQDYVIGVSSFGEGYKLICQSGEEIFADLLFICAGYLSSEFLGIVKNETARDHLQRSKPVRGSFLRFQSDKPIASSFSLALDKRHLIFRESDQSVLLGSTSENDSAVQIPMHQELSQVYLEVKASLAAFGGESSKAFELPPIEEWEIVHGVRHKGAKRMPFWGELAPNCYGIFGLYKNAFSFSFLAAKQLSASLNQ